MQLDLKSFKNYGFVIGLALLIISVTLNIGFKRENDLLLNEKKQKELALKELELVRKENVSLYKKYFDVSNELDKQLEKLKNADEKILFLNNLVIRYEKILSSGYGVIVKDTVIKEECKGLELKFNKDTELYNYDLTVIVNDPPFHSLNFQLKELQGLQNYIGLDANNNFISTFIVPDKYRNFLKIGSMKPIIDEKVFSYFSNIKEEVKMEFFAGSTIALIPKFNLAVGGGFYYKDNYFSYYKGIGDNYHYISYNRVFSTINF